jgi:hypothetical protein
MKQNNYTAFITVILASAFLVIAVVGCIPEVGVTAAITLTPRYSLGTPPAIESYTVNISHPQIVTVVVDDYNPGDTINVPGGLDLSVDLTANVADGESSAALTYSAVFSVTGLSPGDSMAYTPEMTVSSTRLLVPEKYNSRITQIDSMSGENPGILEGSDIGYTLHSFDPTDIDFDALGRLLVSSDYSSAGVTGVFMIDDMSSDTYQTVVADQDVEALAVDRHTNTLYFVSSFNIFSADLDDTYPVSPTSLDVTGLSFTGFQGVEYDGNGRLYLACGSNGAILYDIATESAVTELAIGVDLWDLHYRDGFLLAANDYGASGECILQLDPISLVKIGGYGDTTEDTVSTQGAFFGPHRFIAQLNDEYTVFDENQYVPNARLVQFSDLTGSGWSLFGSIGSDPGDFIGFETPF